MIDDKKCNDGSVIIIREIVDKNANKRYICPPIKYNDVKNIFFQYENLGDKIKILYYDICDLKSIKKRNIKLLHHGDRISKKDVDFLMSLANLDEKLSKYCYNVIYNKERETMEDISKRKESKKSYKIF